MPQNILPFLSLNNSKPDRKFYVSSNKSRVIRNFEVKTNKLLNTSTFVLNEMDRSSPNNFKSLQLEVNGSDWTTVLTEKLNLSCILVNSSSKYSLLSLNNGNLNVVQ